MADPEPYCANCRSLPYTVRKLFILTLYGDVRALLTLHKFRYYRSIGPWLGIVPGGWLSSVLEDDRPYLVVPVPSAPMRRQIRGYVQSDTETDGVGGQRTVTQRNWRFSGGGS